MACTGAATILALSGLARAQVVDQTPPACKVERDAASTSSFAFIAQELTPTDTGVFAVALSPDSNNLVLTTEPFTAGASSVRFRLEAIDPSQPAEGGAVVADGEGNHCAVSVSLAARSS
jgi:hypothetical protein